MFIQLIFIASAIGHLRADKAMIQSSGEIPFEVGKIVIEPSEYVNHPEMNQIIVKLKFNQTLGKIKIFFDLAGNNCHKEGLPDYDQSVDMHGKTVNYYSPIIVTHTIFAKESKEFELDVFTHKWPRKMEKMFKEYRENGLEICIKNSTDGVFKVIIKLII